MPNYLEYRKSISKELLSIKDRVRNFIDNNHWGEDGRYKEIILSEVLKNVLPQNVSVGTGFVMGEHDRISTQIDIMVYKNDYPVLFKMADFAVIPKESVLGIIEVKSNIRSGNIQEAIEKSHNNGVLIGRNIFNGIFGYETEFTLRAANSFPLSILSPLRNYHGYVNHICFDKDIFMKYWHNGNPNAVNGESCYSTYEISDLAFGYFISNLIEDIYCMTNHHGISGVMQSCLYPIEGTKEAHRLEQLEVLLGEEV